MSVFVVGLSVHSVWMLMYFKEICSKPNIKQKSCKVYGCFITSVYIVYIDTGIQLQLGVFLFVHMVNSFEPQVVFFPAKVLK